MQAGAAARAARGKRRKQVTDWPLMGASEYKHVVLGPILLKDVEHAIAAGRSRVMSSQPTGSQATRQRCSSSSATNTLLRACSE